MPAVPDPHGIGAAAARLSGNGRRAGRVPLVVLASVLGEGDAVTVLVVGRFRGEGGVAALLGDRVVLVNERQWKPDVVSFPLDSALAVQGWQDDRSASLTFVVGESHDVIDTIVDRGLAIEMAQRIRQATGTVPEPPPPPARPAPAPPPGAAPASGPAPTWSPTPTPPPPPGGAAPPAPPPPPP
jgi:hypothetical protein